MEKNNVSPILVGVKSIGQYGGYESFIQNLIEYHSQQKSIHYYVYCKANGSGYMDVSKLPEAQKISDTEFLYYNAHCFLLHVPEIGPAQAIYYDAKTLHEACKLIKKEQPENSIV